MAVKAWKSEGGGDAQKIQRSENFARQALTSAEALKGISKVRWWSLTTKGVPSHQYSASQSRQGLTAASPRKHVCHICILIVIIYGLSPIKDCLICVLGHEAKAIKLPPPCLSHESTPSSFPGIVIAMDMASAARALIRAAGHASVREPLQP